MYVEMFNIEGTSERSESSGWSKDLLPSFHLLPVQLPVCHLMNIEHACLKHELSTWVWSQSCVPSPHVRWVSLTTSFVLNEAIN